MISIDLLGTSQYLRLYLTWHIFYKKTVQKATGFDREIT